MIEYALIVAGGSGKRMNSSLPKQFMEINDRPILMHTIDAFLQYSKGINIVLVLPNNQISYWHKLVQEHDFFQPIQLVHGGDTRLESVSNGLQVIVEEGLVAIHDGVRPLVSINIIKNSFESAREHGSGVAVVEPKDSLRELSEGSNKNVDRNNYRIIQTPQTFRTSLIKEAYAATTNNLFTDDASVAEANGNKIVLIDGDYRNIKITTPEDIKIAQALIVKESDISN